MFILDEVSKGDPAEEVTSVLRADYCEGRKKLHTDPGEENSGQREQGPQNLIKHLLPNYIGNESWSWGLN